MSTDLKQNGQRVNRYNIQVLDRAIRVLSLLSDGKQRTANQIVESIHLTPSTTFRLLSTLAEYGYVRRDERTREYRLGLACLELARAYQDSNDLRKVALPMLETLRDEVKETIHLAVLNQMEVVYLEKLQGLHAIGLMSSKVGGRSPAFCTGVGKAMLAYQEPEYVKNWYLQHGLPRYTNTTICELDSLMQELHKVRKCGFAFDHGEHEYEVHCIAAPIFDFTGTVVAALSISGPSSRMAPLENNQDTIQKALQAAASISHQLGYSWQLINHETS